MSQGEHSHRTFPARLAFFLNNPVRRLLYPPSTLVNILAVRSTDTVVDFGCGPGFYTTEVAKRAKKTYAVDMSETMLQKARKAAEKAGVQVVFLQGDGQDIPLADGEVDLIVLIHVFHEIRQKGKVLLEMKRILCKDGRMAVVERSKPYRFNLRVFGPPVISQSEITGPTVKAGFTISGIKPHRSDSLVILRKTS